MPLTGFCSQTKQKINKNQSLETVEIIKATNEPLGKRHYPAESFVRF